MLAELHVLGVVLIFSTGIVFGSKQEPLPSELGRLPPEVYLIRGDVYLGTIQVVHDYSKTSLCSAKVSRFGELQLLLATIWAVKQINSFPDILGNVTLGLVGLDHCYRSATAVGQAWRLMTGAGRQDLDITLEPWPHFIGVIGPLHSVSTMAATNVFTVFNVPQVSPTATSDELSDRTKFPYLYRVVPPGSFVARTMGDLLEYFGWSYITVLYEESTYGFNDLKYLRKIARVRGICIKDAHPLSEGFNDQDYDELLRKLYKGLRQESQAIVVFAVKYKLAALFKGVKRLKANGRFLWLLSETAYMEVFSGVEDELQGAITISWESDTNHDLKSYMENLTPDTDTANPWLPQIWKQYFPTEGTNSTTGAGKSLSTAPSDICNKSCRIRDLPGFSYYPSANTSVDSVVVFAKALDKYIGDQCPEAFTNKSRLASCLDRRTFHDYVKNVSIDTPHGTLSFTSNGSMIRNYRITQLQKRNGRWSLEEIGIWSVTKGDVMVYRDRLQWFAGRNDNQNGTAEAKNVTLQNGTLHGPAVPKSICSEPCNLGEFSIQGELSCCWDCRKCRSNEIVADNGTTCIECRETTWPHPGTLTVCEDIPPHYLKWLQPYGLGLLAVAGGGFLIVLIIISLVIRHKAHKVIKGAGREMITLILIGLSVAFLTVFAFIAKPNHVICPAARIGFSLSCTLIFGPLLVKTNRVYQVFAASAKLSRSVRMASMRIQCFLTIVVILIQVALSTVAASMWPAKPVITMPVRTEKYVELHCYQDQKGLLLPLSYNLLLIFACSVFAFLTRKLPDNFNESWYIFLSVCTTLVIWIAFLPTYYITFYAYHKSALLAVALILNGAVTIACLFIPKIYAIFYVDEKNIKVTDFDETEFSPEPGTLSVSDLVKTRGTSLRIPTDSLKSDPKNSSI